MHVPALFIAGAANREVPVPDGIIGGPTIDAALIPIVRHVQHEAPAAARSLEGRARNVPTASAPFVVVEHGGHTIIRDDENVHGTGAGVSLRIRLTQDVNRELRAPTEISGEHVEHRRTVANESARGRALILAAPQRHLYTRT